MARKPIAAYYHVILERMKAAAASNTDLPCIAHFGKELGIKSRTMHDRLTALDARGLIKRVGSAIYEIDGKTVFFGDRNKKRQPAILKTRRSGNADLYRGPTFNTSDARYERFPTSCLCCGSRFDSEKLVKFREDGSVMKRTIYRLCYNCRTRDAA